MVDSINSHTPSPFEWNDREHNADPFSGNGSLLFQKTSEFYFWCMTREKTSPQTRELLSTIMQISKTSALTGSFLSEDVEKKAADELADIKDALQSGHMQASGIDTSLLRVVTLLSDYSSKARLVSEITQCEFAFSIRNEARLTDQEKTQLDDKLRAILDNISPKLQELHAEAIAREIHRLRTEQPPPHPEAIFQELDACLELWMR